MTYKNFWKAIQEYFSIYLPKQRNSSEKTLDTCQKAWNMLLRYLIQERRIPVSEISFESFTKELVVEFLDEMELKKSWKPSTRNNRLSCIRAFFKYAGSNCSEAYIVYANLQTIPMKKGVDESRVVNYLSEDALSSIMECIDTGKRDGLRNKFFLTLMYDTAARNGEMLKIKFSDINKANSSVYLFGKGAKPRIVPVTKDTLRIFDKYAKIYHEDRIPDDYLFYTMHQGKRTRMSDDNVSRFLTGYAKQAREKNPNVPEKVHPHMIRHSRAMHLYKGGMSLSVLSEFLGHENPETTLIYAHADIEMKRKAIECASKNLILPGIESNSPIWQDNDIIQRLIKGF